MQEAQLAPDRVDHDADDVPFFQGLPVLLALLVARVPELSVVRSPAKFSVTESLILISFTFAYFFRVYPSLAYPDFE